MRIHLGSLGLLFLLATPATRAAADAPTSYQCDPGIATRGACSCPTGFTSARDDQNRAICYAVKVAPPPPPPPPQIRIVKVMLAVNAKPPAVVDRATIKPEITADQVLSIEGLAGPVRSEQEQILDQLIANTPDSEVEEKSDYLFRLGELHAKQARAFRQAGNAAKATDYLRKAVKTYKVLTETEAFRNYPKMDMALFYYGYTLQNGKYMKEARAVYDKLLKNFPNSKYVPEAHLAFADYYFESNQLADAEARYKMVLKFPKSSVYWYAMYKMGWIHLDLQRFQEALETFFQVAQATKNDAKLEVMNRVAKHDFVRAYAEIGKIDKAYPAFSRVDSKDSELMMGGLADVFIEQGKLDKAIVVYQELIKQSPTSPNACTWLSNIARATALTYSGKLVDVCTTELPALKEWARANGGSAR